MAVNEPHFGPITSVNLGLDVPWVQYVGRSTPAHVAFSLSWGSNQGTMAIDVNMFDLLTVIPLVLGTANRVFADRDVVTGVNLLSGGFGYQTPPYVVFSGGGGGSGAQAIATVSAGTHQVSAITLTKSGQGYTSAPIITFVGGNAVGSTFVPATANAVVGKVSVPTISRFMPMRFPYIPHMIAMRIQGQPIIFTGKSGGFPALPTPIPASANFTYCRLTVNFGVPNYNVIDDTVLESDFDGDESQRFVSWKRVNTLYALSRRGADFQYTETSTTGGAGPPLAGGGSLIKFGLTQLLAKQQIIARWTHIPEQSLFPQGPYGPSPHIDNAYGGVNNQTWNGWAAGTVLFENWKPEEEESPYPFSLTTYLKPQRLWAVEFSFRVFDPPTDPGNPSRGWNCQPFTDGLWYFASQLNNKGIGILRPVDLNQVFVSN